MKSILFAILITPILLFSDQYVGTFSNMKYSEESAIGEEIELWKDKNGFFYGFFYQSEGIIGDTPTGILENISYDPKEKSFSFTAKLTTGSIFISDKQEDAKDLFQFKGILKKNQITGNLTHYIVQLPNDTEIKTIILKKQKQKTFINSHEDFIKFFNEIKSFRGPKW